MEGSIFYIGEIFGKAEKNSFGASFGINVCKVITSKSKKTKTNPKNKSMKGSIFYIGEIFRKS